ncbi:PP2C family protein-serine/threonine phosphatase [Anatilimnocola floriformis]|uniref:PP2C family protein-serine/threonine phosphatase n=1 Tax=Anatilimnocola floriformis TaxID=2948575 RepID=UPI0020C1C1F0|nr:protein phosphatase 2C domain-containing protein [Anatilimnocola floriformis]
MAFDCGVQTASLTNVGMRRSVNQDSYVLIVADTHELWQQRGHFLMVADGMGAHAAGELASKMAVESSPYLYNKYVDMSAPEALERAIRESNTAIHNRGTANTDFHGMGTTASALVLLPQGAVCAHVGDSRIYRLRGSQLNQLSFDHSLQWELRASGQLTEGSELAAAVPKNVITRSLGPNANVQIDLEGPHPIEVGDVYLLCSDGLTGRVEDNELGTIMGCLPPHEAVKVLVDLANLRGGPDNITVLIAKIVKPDAATAGNQSPPLVLGGKKDLKPVNPIIWIVAGVFALAAVLLPLRSLYIPAGVSLLAALIAGIFGLVKLYSGYSKGTQLTGNRRLGKGPYTSTPCGPTPAFFSKIQHTAAELKQVAVDGHYNVDWAEYDELQRKAVAAQQANPVDAVRQLCKSITFLMNELRTQHNRKTSDSEIKL